MFISHDLNQHSTITFKPSRRSAILKASAACSSGKRVRDQRTHIHFSAFHQLDGARVGEFHPPDQFDGQSFAAGKRGRKGCAVIGRDAGQDDTPAGFDGGEWQSSTAHPPRRLRRTHPPPDQASTPGRPELSAASRRWGSGSVTKISRRSGQARQLDHEQPDRSAAEDANRHAHPQVSQVHGMDGHPQGSSITPSASESDRAVGTGILPARRYIHASAPSSDPCPAKRICSHRLGFPCKQYSQA